jgi:UDPglucose 6-dehydrogenase
MDNNENNNKNITVIGIGKLGLGFALLLEKSGYNVLGVDIFQDYVNQINDKSIKFSEPNYNELLEKSENLKATTSIDEGLHHSNIIFIIVQTPNGGGSRFTFV